MSRKPKATNHASCNRQTLHCLLQTISATKAFTTICTCMISNTSSRGLPDRVHVDMRRGSTEPSLPDWAPFAASECGKMGFSPSMSCCSGKGPNAGSFDRLPWRCLPTLARTRASNTARITADVTTRRAKLSFSFRGTGLTLGSVPAARAVYLIRRRREMMWKDSN